MPGERTTEGLEFRLRPRLGKWLSQRAGIPFEDLATDERRAIELAQLRTQLETILPRMGPLGNLVRSLVDRAEARRKA